MNNGAWPRTWGHLIVPATWNIRWERLKLFINTYTLRVQRGTPLCIVYFIIRRIWELLPGHLQQSIGLASTKIYKQQGNYDIVDVVHLYSYMTDKFTVNSKFTLLKILFILVEGLVLITIQSYLKKMGRRVIFTCTNVHAYVYIHNQQHSLPCYKTAGYIFIMH